MQLLNAKLTFSKFKMNSTLSGLLAALHSFIKKYIYLNIYKYTNAIFIYAFRSTNNVKYMKEESSSSNQTNATMKDYKLILFITYFCN